MVPNYLQVRPSWDEVLQVRNKRTKELCLLPCLLFCCRLSALLSLLSLLLTLVDSRHGKTVSETFLNLRFEGG